VANKTQSQTSTHAHSEALLNDVTQLTKTCQTCSTHILSETEQYPILGWNFAKWGIQARALNFNGHIY
jgi:hypothetical protein